MVEAILRRKTDSSGLHWKPQDDGNGSSVAAPVTGGLPAEFYNFFWMTTFLLAFFLTTKGINNPDSKEKKPLQYLKRQAGGL